MTNLTVEQLAALLYDRFARIDHERQDMARIRADTVAAWLLPRLGGSARYDTAQCDACGGMERCLIAPSADDAPYQICEKCLHGATRA